jgi:hypothetical protein
MGRGAEVSRGQSQLVEQLLGIRVVYKERILQAAQKGRPAKPQAYPQGYVEDFNELRTKLADFFSSLLGLGFAVVEMPMLPVEPGMAKFVGENVAPSGYG